MLLEDGTTLILNQVWGVNLGGGAPAPPVAAAVAYSSITAAAAAVSYYSLSQPVGSLWRQGNNKLAHHPETNKTGKA